MRLNDLIIRLQTLQADQGDLPVFCRHEGRSTEPQLALVATEDRLEVTRSAQGYVTRVEVITRNVPPQIWIE